jgi:hypothetical protein
MECCARVSSRSWGETSTQRAAAKETKRPIIQGYFNIQQYLFQLLEGKICIANSFPERVLHEPHHSLENPAPPWTPCEIKLLMDFLPSEVIVHDLTTFEFS